MNIELTLEKKAFVLIAVPLIFQIIFIASVYHLISEVDRQWKQETHSRDVMEQVSDILREFLDRLSYDFISKNVESSHEEKVRRKRDRKIAIQKVLKLKSMVKGNREQVEVCDNVLTAFSTPFEEIHHTEREKLLKLKLLQIRMAVNDLFTKITRTEKRNKEKMQKLKKQTKAQLEYLFFIGLFFNTSIAITLAVIFNRSTSLRMNQLIDNTHRFAADEDLLPQLEGADELAELDAMFRAMADSIKEVQERERAIVENALDVICIITEDGKINEVNPAAEQLWGYEEEELLGAHVVTIIESDELSGFLDKLESTKNLDVTTSATFENRVKRKDGTSAPTSWAVRWSESDHLYYCVAHDFTEREKVDELRRELVAMVSHDLKAPLTSIQLSLNLISSGACGEINEKIEKKVNTAERNAVRLLGLIRDLLDLEKMDTGKMEINKSNCNLSHIVEQAVDTVSAKADSKEIKIETKNVDKEIEVDGERIVQVIANFMSNAVKFSPEGGTITVFSESIDDGLKIGVADQGPGIKPDVLPTVFDRFGKIERSEANLSGTGLGLAIAKAIVDSHEGEIGVDSELGKGTTFWFVV